MSSLEDYKYELREKPLFNQQLRAVIAPTTKILPSYSLSLTDFLVEMSREMSMEVKVEIEMGVEADTKEEQEDWPWIGQTIERIAEDPPKDEEAWAEIIRSFLKHDLAVEFFIVHEESITMDDESSIFHVLACKGYHGTLKSLLTEACSAGGMVENKGNRQGDTALHLAVANGDLVTVKVLLEHGKVGKDLDRRNNKGETVFHLACDSPDTDIRNDVVRTPLDDIWDIILSSRRCGSNETWNDPTRMLVLLLSRAGKKSETLDECLAKGDNQRGHTFFHRLVVSKSYDFALKVLERSTKPGVQNALGKVACESADIYGDTALMLLLKNESPFFRSKIGRSDVEREVKLQFKNDSSNETVNSSNQPLGRKTALGITSEGGTSTPRTSATLLVKLMRIWIQAKKDKTVSDTFLLYLGNLDLVDALHPFFREARVQKTNFPSGANVLQTAARDRMTKFIEWFIKGTEDDVHLAWTGAILHSSDVHGRTALHYAAMLAPLQVDHAVGGFATEIKQDYQWFERIKAIMPADLVSKKSEPVIPSLDKQGKTAEGSKDDQPETASETFIRVRKDKAEKHGESARAMANTIMSLVAAVAFATTFTLPNGLVENSGNLKHKDVVRFTSFVCTYVLGLSFATATIYTALALYQSPFTVRNFCSSIPRLFRLCVGSLSLCLLFMLVAFGNNLQISFARLGMTKFTSLYALISVGPLLTSLVCYRFVRLTATTKGPDL